jgi:MoaA/NifB/PqqE/SkfB family radical SAM enzyme
MHDDILPIIQEFESHGIRVNMSSNGYLIDEEVARLLGKAGLTTLCLSLESSESAVNDGIRGSGSYDKVIEAITHVHRWAPRIKICLGATLMRNNLSTIAGIPAIARKYGAHSVRVQLVRNGFEQVGLDHDRFDRIRIVKDHLADVSHALTALRRSAEHYGIRVESNEYMNDIRQALRGERKTPCLAGEMICCIKSDGRASPCPNIDMDLHIDQGLRHIWNAPELVNFRCSKRTCVANCSDSTYNNISCAARRFLTGRWFGLLHDLKYYSKANGQPVGRMETKDNRVWSRAGDVAPAQAPGETWKAARDSETAQ